MVLRADRQRLEDVLAEAETWRGVYAVRGWVNEGRLAVGDDIMKVLVAGDIRENVSAALQRLVTVIKNDVVSESELR
jgi:molybdopterin synthase catalytic subunit